MGHTQCNGTITTTMGLVLLLLQNGTFLPQPLLPNQPTRLTSPETQRPACSRQLTPPALQPAQTTGSPQPSPAQPLQLSSHRHLFLSCLLSSPPQACSHAPASVPPTSRPVSTVCPPRASQRQRERVPPHSPVFLLPLFAQPPPAPAPACRQRTKLVLAFAHRTTRTKHMSSSTQPGQSSQPHGLHFSQTCSISAFSPPLLLPFLLIFTASSHCPRISASSSA